ncbi:MAG: pimeloyl-ACP methyl ester carboxylesterase [Kiritimatiellia bacterium]|jgi:pimeloyl-ACP methyl ester carboxylesterase
MIKIYLALILLPLLMACSGRDIIIEGRELTERSLNNNPPLAHYQLLLGENKLHYAANGNSKNPALIIIHGTPGSWRQYAPYLFNVELLAHYYVIVIDRPGWGESTLAQGKEIASFNEQAQIIAVLAKRLRQQNQGQPVVLMGHSLGASLAPQVAMDFPDLIDGLLLFAGTLDPELSSPRWFNYAAEVVGVNYIIGSKMSRANKEIFALKHNIQLMSSRWQELQAEVISVQGMKDDLVDPDNSFYIEKTFNADTTKVVRLKDEGHLFPMTMKAEVVSWAKQLLIDIRKRSN